MMSEHLKQARRLLERTDMEVETLPRWALKPLVAMDEILCHLEAQQETPDMESALASIWAELDRKQDLPSVSQTTERPVLSSSEATETAAGMSDTYRTFWSKSYPANLGLIDWRPAARDISVWLSSLPILGNELGVEIGVTLTSKASTLQSGSASPSTGDLTREASGVAGRSIPCPDGIEGCAVLHLSPASSPEPAQGESDWAVLMSNMLYTLETDNAGHLRVNGLEYELMPSRTMKEGSERG